MDLKKSISLLVFITLVVLSDAQDNHSLKLWYNQPAQFFEESLVLGNGKSGASVFGGVNSDKIYLNDATLWSGEPVDPYMNPDAYKHIPEIREALANEDYQLADELNKQIQGKFSQSFAPLGTMYIDLEHQGEAANYYRELDIESAVSGMSYEVDGAKYTREYFISYPDQVMVVKLSCDKKEALNFSVRFNSLLKYKLSTSDNTLKINGYAPYQAEPSYRGNMSDAIKFDESRGTRFSGYFKIKHDGGELSINDSLLTLKNANQAILFVSLATSFNGCENDPAKKGLDNKAIAEEQLNKAYSKDYSTLKEAHIRDYQTFFKRVTLDLGVTEAPGLPTNERLKRYASGKEDKNLEILYFQFGRYLLISSSRTEGVPANLQGIWNPYIRPPWSSNYTMNINAEENYWLAESANLTEMHQPFLGFIGKLAKTGKVTAQTFYGVNKGWASCHNSDIWAMSNPVGDFGKGNPVWACWNMGGTWASTHLWDHYLFTQDKDFLKNYAWPLMKGAAAFCLEWLVKDKKGYLVTSPSTSPENVYKTPNGYKGATLYGSTADLAMIKECFAQTIKASEVLKIDIGFRDSLKAAMSQMYPYQIGSKGNLQEWYHDWEDAEPKHRHQSHLFGLYPGHQISPERTPELAAACKKTLEIKGDETTGWSKGWRINLWARLLDGDHAYKMYRELLRYVEPDGAKKTEYSGGGGTYPNMFDAHPPFQIDGNFGGAAGVIEMLLQSHQGVVELLPALPSAWPVGEVKGLVARGGFVIDIRWQNGKPTGVNVHSKQGGLCVLKYKGKEIAIKTRKNNDYTVKGVSF